MSDRGATPAYRGYRLQALYALSRIVAPGLDSDLIFHPEGLEDLDIEAQNAHLIEAIQVKSYDSLILSHLSPEKKNSFFHRAIRLITSPDTPKIKLVNFGTIGEEMRIAWSGDGKHREQVFRKLNAFGYQDEDIQALFENLELVELVEEDMEEAVFAQLREQLVGIDPATAFDLLNYWLYIQSENRARTTRLDLIQRIQHIGRFLSERYHHHHEWFTSIQPIEDAPVDVDQLARLQEEFYAGVSARYEHILAGLDFRRDQKMVEIKQAFERTNVVIIHAASGQGKSALAYRYLEEAYPGLWRFSIELIENRRHALNIAVALSGHARAVQAPMAIYIDVSPSDPDWPELVQRIARESYIQVLVTIREEDFRRASISNVFDYVPVDLSFNQKEARLIFERARDADHAQDYLNFEEAWHIFGGQGPLMEFVYLLTQTQTLRQRLEEQVDRIRREVRERKLAPDELELLRLVAVATAYDARVRLPSLLERLELPEPGLTLELYEKEYLLKATPDYHYIVGLHPIRSQILADLLTESGVYPWMNAAQRSSGLIPEDDWEIFFLQAFIGHTDDFEQILNILLGLRPSTWAGFVGTLRCLLWAGLRRYVRENWRAAEAARDLFGPGSNLIMDLNFAGDDAPNLEGWWRSLGDLIPENRQSEIERIRQSQSPKEAAFEFAATWVAGLDERPGEPASARDWSSTAETLYWATRFEQGNKVSAWLSDEALSSSIENLSIAALSELSFGLFAADSDRCMAWLDDNRQTLESKLASELNIVAIEEDDETLTINILTYPDGAPIEESIEESKKKSLHDETIERLQIVRQLFPQHKKYGAKGYGHQIPGLGLERYDDTEKTGVAREHLPPRWPIWANGIATGLIQNRFRPANWAEYLHQSIEARQGIISCLSALVRGMSHYFSREKAMNLLQMKVISSGDWDRYRLLANDRPVLPRTAVDTWGMARPEGKLQGGTLDLEKFLPRSLLGEIYKPYLEAERKYFFGIANFMEQSPQVMITNYYTGKLPEDSPQKRAALKRLRHENIKTDLQFLSFYNLSEAKSALPSYQKSFRALFGDRPDLNTLAELEANENRTIAALWGLWHYFANHPRAALSNPLRQICARLDAVVSDLERKYDEAVGKVQREGIQAQRLAVDLNWDGSPAVWILLDVQDSTDMYPTIDALIHALRGAIGTTDHASITHTLIDDYFKFTVIVPTVRGKLISPLLWPLRTVFTITSDEPVEEKQWAYIPQPASSDLLEELGLSAWDSEEINNANQLADSIKALALITSMLAKINDIPGLTEAGAELLQKFMDQRSGELSEMLQTLMNAGTKLLDNFNSLSEEEQAKRPYLLEGVSHLSEIHKQVLPSEHLEEQKTIDIQALVRWSERLRETTLAVEAIKFLWIADAIERSMK